MQKPLTFLSTAAAIVLFAAVAFLAADPATAAARQPKTYTLDSQRAVGALDRVQFALEAEGDQKITQEGKLTQLKMHVRANVSYDEKSLEVSGGAGGPLRSVRRYTQAEATIQVEEAQFKAALPDTRRLIAATVQGPAVTLFSPHGTLTRDELDLIVLPGDSLLLDRLLPDKPVAAGVKWEHSTDVMAALLGLDAVSQTGVESLLRTVRDGTAQIEMAGNVEGAVGGVSTEITLKARYHFDLGTGRITWFALATKEDRSIGHVGPGLDVVARMQMKISPLEKSTQLDDAALADLTLTSSAELTQLNYRSLGGKWRVAHDRKWFITADEADLAILRLIDQGEFVAQCNVHALSDATSGESTTLAEFQDDIKHGLGQNFDQFVQAGQRANKADYRVYRVVAAGEVSSLPIEWTYYLVVDKHGRRVVLAFTVEGGLVDQFAGADQELLSTFRLADPEVAAVPTPAEKR